MWRLCERLARLWAASLLLEEADAEAGERANGSYRKLVVAVEYLRRRLLVPEGEVWLGPRPAAGQWFDAVVDCAPVPAEAVMPLLEALAEEAP
jgi:hypothetical protein